MWGRSVMTEKQLKEEYGPLNGFPEDYDSMHESNETQHILGKSSIDEDGLHYHQTENGASVGAAVWNIVCIIAGFGILSLPKAMSDSGWLGIGVLIISALVADYSGRILIKSFYVNRLERLVGGFPEVGEAAFGRVGYYVVHLFHKSTLLGVCILFLILAGENFYAMIGDKTSLDTRTWILVIGAVVWLPLFLLKNVKEISIVSLFGLLASAVVVVVVVVLALVDYFSLCEDLPYVEVPCEPAPPHSIFRLETFASAFASMSFSYGGSAVYPHIEHSMKNPQKFGKALSISMCIVTAMYLPVAIVGYLVYGETAESPILNNLPEGWALTMATALITSHVILAYPLPMMAVVLELEPLIEAGTDRLLKYTGRPVEDDIEPLLEAENKESANSFKRRSIEFILRAIVRTIVIGATIIVAFFVGGNFGKFFDLVAALSNTALIYILPVLFYWKLSGIKMIPKWELVIGAMVVLLGLVAGGIGTYNAILAFV